MKNYRLYTIYRLSNLRVLDFQKVKLKEKVLAKNLFDSEKGKKLIEDMKNKIYMEDETEYMKAAEEIKKDTNKQKMLYELIQNTQSIEEMRKIERNFLTGNLDKEKDEDNQDEDVYNN